MPSPRAFARLAPWLGLAAALALPAGALPDLVVEITGTDLRDGQVVPDEDVAEGCAGGTSGRRLLRFGLRTANVGADDLVLGDPDCPNCASNPGAACQNPLYQCSPAHGHAHFEDYVLAELLDASDQVVAAGQKQGFCLLDSDCPQGNFTYHCGFQGISQGCADIYGIGLPCQYIDVTDVPLPDGVYTLRVTVDFTDLLPEEDETNNATSVPVLVGSPPPGCGDGTLDPDEACDDGNREGGDCCSADCLVAASDGTPCSEPGHCLVGGTCEAGDCAEAEVHCDPCLQCVPPDGCVVPEEVLCETLPPRQSKLSLARNPRNADKDKLAWSWRAGAPVDAADFGDPALSTDLTVCVFDEDGLVSSATAPAGAACGGKDCWKASEKRIRYSDVRGAQGPVRKLKLKPGDAGRARIAVKAQGGDLGLPETALSGEVTVRLQRSGGPACWEARFDDPARNDWKHYKGKVRN